MRQEGCEGLLLAARLVRKIGAEAAATRFLLAVHFFLWPQELPRLKKTNPLKMAISVSLWPQELPVFF